MARLYIKDKKYSEVVLWLNEANSKLAEDVKYDDETKKHILYKIHKNRGWALVEQGEYKDAKLKLMDAIELGEKDLGLSKSEEGAFPHCLLAQVLEKEGNKKDASEKRSYCIKYGDPLDIDLAK